MTLIPRGSFFDIDRFVDDFWAPSNRAQNNTGNTFFAPHVDIVERDNHYEITAEMPGMKKVDIHINLKMECCAWKQKPVKKIKRKKMAKSFANNAVTVSTCAVLT